MPCEGGSRAVAPSGQAPAADEVRLRGWDPAAGEDVPLSRQPGLVAARALAGGDRTWAGYTPGTGPGCIHSPLRYWVS